MSASDSKGLCSVKGTCAVAALALGFAMASPAQAADLYDPAPAGMSPFHGYYVGVHGGRGSGDSKGWWAALYSGVVDSDTTPVGNDGFEYDDEEGEYYLTGVDYKHNRDGWFLGGHAGANYVTADGLLFGAEVSVSMADIDGSYTADDSESLGELYSYLDEEGFNYARDENGGSEVWSTINAIGLFQGKMGYANNDFAVYFSGGLALAQSEYWNDWGASINTVHSGWTVGGGADMMVTDDVSVGIAYNHVKLNREPQAASFNVVGFDVNLARTNKYDINMVTLKLDYHF